VRDLLLNSLVKTINFALPLLLIIFIAMVISEIIIEMGLLKKIKKIGAITKLANLPEVCGLTFAVAIISPTAANSMLQNMRENKILSDKEVLLASLLNSTIVPLRETFTYHLPVILPILGLYVGIIYVGTIWLSSLALLTFVIIYGRMNLKNTSKKINVTVNNYCNHHISIGNIIKRCLNRFKRISVTLIVTSFLLFTMLNLSLTKKIEEYIMPLGKIIGLPSQIFPAIAAYIVSPIVGFSMLATLLHNGIITEHDAIISLLLGSIFMIPILYMRFYFPQWISIFGLKLGILRGIISLSISITIRIIILLILLNIYK